MSSPSDIDTLKRRAAAAAVEYVHDGYLVGLGTGSTAGHVVRALGERVRAGLRIKGVPTSQETAELAKSTGIPLLPDQEAWPIDVTIDGADQVDPQLNLIKGGGGALLREKIVAAASKQLIIVVDATKRVPVLGGPCPLPIDVVRFGWPNTARRIEALGGEVALRERDGRVFTTESGHYILDCRWDRIEDPAALEMHLNRIPGVVESGLFVGRTTILIAGTPQGVEVQKAGRQRGSV